MDTMTTVIVAIVAVAAIAFFVWYKVSVRRLESGRMKVKPVEFVNDPASCEHDWRVRESAACMPSYSSYDGPEPQETWTVECCPLCGAERFSCTGPCDCVEECAASYGQGASA